MSRETVVGEEPHPKSFISAQAKLRKLDSKFYWLASGAIKIPQNTPQYRLLNSKLRKMGLRGPTSFLTLE